MGRLIKLFIIIYPIFYIPFFFISPWYVGHKLVALSLTAVLLWLFFLFNYIKNRKDFDFKLSDFKKIKLANKFLLAFVILFIFSVFFSVDMKKTLIGTVQRYEGLAAWFSYFTFFIFTLSLLKKQKTNFYTLIYLVTIYVSIRGIVEHFNFSYLMFFGNYIGKEKLTRSSVFFDNPNFFGSYLVLMFFIGILVYLLSKNNKLVVLNVIGMCLIQASLLYSLTRSAWLGISFALILLGLFLFWKRKEFLPKYFIVIVALIVVALAINYSENNKYLGRAGTIFMDAGNLIVGEEDGHGGSNRMYIWKNSLPLVKDYFWFGSGPDTFAVVFPHKPNELREIFNDPTITIDKAHNEYLQIAVTMGIPALIAYLCFLTTIVATGLKALIRTKGESQIVLLCLLLSIIGYMVQAFFNISTVPVTPYFWIFLGLTYRISIDILNNEKTFIENEVKYSNLQKNRND